MFPLLFSYSRNKIIAKNVRKVNDIVTLRTFEVFFFGYGKLFFIDLSHLHCTNLKRKSEEVDESFRIMVVIELTCGKACK